MVNDGDYVVIFNSIHRVMKAEKVLKGHGLPILLIPAPRSLSADCGLAIRYRENERSEVERVLAAEELLPEEIYLKSGEGFIKMRGDLGPGTRDW